MRVLILGGTGFIGSELAIRLAHKGYDVEILTRTPDSCSSTFFNHPKIFCSPWNGSSSIDLEPYVEGVTAVVNLLGASIAEYKWTPRNKEILVDSRLNSTKALAAAVRAVHVKPEVVVQGSAVGFYGYEFIKHPTADEFSERGAGFLAELTDSWEDAILPVKKEVKRLVIVRTGIVLGNKGGMLRKLKPIFALGLGGNVGTGKQPFPWISIHDEVGAIIHLIESAQVEGVFNLAAPATDSYNDFVKALGKVLHRPTFFAIPTAIAKLAFGEEKANEILLGGKYVIPKRLLDTGYQFKFTELTKALK